MENPITEAFRNALEDDQVIFEFAFPRGQGSTLSYVTVYLGTITIKGFRVMKSKYENPDGNYLNLVPPGIMSTSHPEKPPYKVFHINDAMLWEIFERKALIKYQKKLKEKDENTHSY